MRLKVVLEPSEAGGYTVYVPALPGCISEGDTRGQALANIKDAIELYLDDFTLAPAPEVAEVAL
jgi:predicted RNase H-like HicB family nuclease